MIKTLIAGNWKMNGLMASLKEVDALDKMLGADQSHVEILICPPATLLSAMVERTKSSPVMCGGQDCHTAPSGAHTGDISALMMKDLGASHIIVGHSERRADHGESNEHVKNKAEAVLDAGLMPIICVGETKAEREAGKALSVVEEQLAGSVPKNKQSEVVIAYEPVWAIGTGLIPTLDDIGEMHQHIRKLSSAVTPILYGGSVKPGNAKDILNIENVNGALVGGASLKAEDFFGIISAA